MNKYVILAQGYVPPTPEIGEAWAAWFDSISDHLVDSGNPLSGGRRVHKDGTVEDLQLGLDSLTGYLIVSAPDMDAAEKLVADCPIITSMYIYEAARM